MILDKVQDIICELLEVDREEVLLNTYLVRDLEVESIDLMELALEIKREFFFSQSVITSFDSELIFLKTLRIEMIKFEAESIDVKEGLANKYKHLSPTRIDEIIQDVVNGPVIRIRDVVAYIDYGLEDE